MSDNASTLQSYVDSATGAVQSAIGSLSGNKTDEVQGDARREQADAQHTASHTVGKLGPVSVTPQGGVSKDSSDRTEGSWNQTVGSAKEAVGGFVGHDGLKADGMRQNREGKEQEAKGQLSDLGKGIGDRVQGTVGSAVAGVMGDEESQRQYNDMRRDGKAAQRSVEADMQKQG